MRTVSLISTDYYLPRKIVPNEFFFDNAQQELNPMFKGVSERRHVSEDETGEYMIVKALTSLMEKLNLNPQRDIDMILTNISVSSEGFMGSGALIAKHISAKPKYVFDFHHSGCISFVTMLELAKAYIETNKVNNAVICNVQNSGGQIFAQKNIRKKPQACVPGDGCGVAYLNASNLNPILSVYQECHTENADSMYCTTECGRSYWQPGSGEAYLEFDESKVAKILSEGNRIVPNAIQTACKQAGIASQKLGMLFTNQPSLIFLRNWREALQVPEEKHYHSFSELGNLFGAAIPINLSRAIENRQLQPGSYLGLGGFSHAGDFSAGSVVQWLNYV